MREREKKVKGDEEEGGLGEVKERSDTPAYFENSRITTLLMLVPVPMREKRNERLVWVGCKSVSFRLNSRRFTSRRWRRKKSQQR